VAVPTMAGFAMRQPRIATAVTVLLNSQPVGIAQHARSHHWNGKMETVIWLPTSPRKPLPISKRLIQSRHPKEHASNISLPKHGKPRSVSERGFFMLFYVLSFRF
jgi:hypothetical protein